MKVIFGLIGEMGSGKGTVAKYIKEKYNGSHHSYSMIARDILDRLYLEHIRENTSGISTVLRNKFGDDLFARVMSKDVERDSKEVIVVDGIRTLSDIEYLKKIAALTLLYIETDIRNCYERILKRQDKPDDLSKTFEKFEEEHALETETRIKSFKQHADFVVDNNGTKEELFQKIDNIINGDIIKTNESQKEREKSQKN